MQSRLDAAVDAKPSKHDLPVPAPSRGTVSEDLAMLVNPYGLRLHAVEVIGCVDLVAYVAFEVPLASLAFRVRVVLLEVFGCPHDELELVRWLGHCKRIYNVVVEAVDGGEEDERLVVQVREDDALNLEW